MYDVQHGIALKYDTELGSSTETQSTGIKRARGNFAVRRTHLCMVDRALSVAGPRRGTHYFDSKFRL